MMRFGMLITALFSLGLHLFGGGSSGGSSSFTPYSPTGLANADTAWQNFLNQEMTNIAGPMAATGSQLPSLYQQLIGNIGNAAPGIEEVASGQAAPYLANMAGQADQFHNILSDQAMKNYGAESTLQGAGNSIWNTALDPQSALKASMQQQVTDASRASTSSRGIGTSPEAAGIENQDVSKFLMDWQNQQLQRQATGLGAMTSAYDSSGKQGQAGGSNLTASQTMSSLAPQLLMQSATLPYQTTEGLLDSGISNATKFMNAEEATQLGPLAGIMGQIIPYLNYGSGAQANAFNAGQDNLSNLTSLFTGGLNQAQQPGGGIFGTLASLFSNPFGASSLFGGGAAATAGAGDLADLGFLFA